MHEDMIAMFDESEIDPECLELCKQMSRYPGIQTIESCCGHGKSDFHIWFVAESLEHLPRLLYWFKGGLSGVYGWRVDVSTGCCMSPVIFTVVGPLEYELRWVASVYDEANIIAKYLKDYADEMEKCNWVDKDMQVE